MAPQFTLSYDPVGDILYLRACPTYPEQDSSLEADGSVIRRNPVTGAVEAVELLSFSRWTLEELANLPIPPELLPLVHASAQIAKAA